MELYVKNAINNKIYGLHVLPPPTGYGKSHIAKEIMKQYVCKTDTNLHFIFITSQKKNLIQDRELQERFGAVLDDTFILKSNLDNIIDAYNRFRIQDIPNLGIPKNLLNNPIYHFKDIINDLQKSISECLALSKESKNISTSFVREFKKQAENAVRQSDEQLRTEIKHYLHKTLHTVSPEKKQHKIHTDSKYSWIGDIYPAVFLSEKHIIFTTVHKFNLITDTLIDKSFILANHLPENTVIFIDEFDATKQVILDTIIDKASVFLTDYLALFRSIYYGLEHTALSVPLQQALPYESETTHPRVTKDRLLKKGAAIIQDYALDKSYKVATELDHQNNVFFFENISTYFNSFNTPAYTRVQADSATNRVSIHFETKKAYEAYKKSHPNFKDISLKNMFKDVTYFLNHFIILLSSWADAYMRMENKKRASIENRIQEKQFERKDAIDTILNTINIKNRTWQNFLRDNVISRANAMKSSSLVPNRSFYSNGLTIFHLEDDDKHNDYTELAFSKILETPEKLLYQLCAEGNQTIVFGMSATADIKTVFSNYDLDWLEDQLGNRYHHIDKPCLKRIAKVEQSYRKAFENGRIRVHTQKLEMAYDPDNNESNDTNFHFLDGDEKDGIVNEYALIFGSHYSNTDKKKLDRFFENLNLPAYCKNRYGRLVQFFGYVVTHDIKYSMYIGPANAKIGNEKWDTERIENLLQLILNAKKIPDDQYQIVCLGGANFEAQKQMAVKQLKTHHVILMTSYGSTGVGQNLQYPVDLLSPEEREQNICLFDDYNPTDARFKEHDLDCIYLDSITHVVPNGGKMSPNEDDNHVLIDTLVAIEEAHEVGEINRYEASLMTREAFARYKNENRQYHFVRNQTYHGIYQTLIKTPSADGSVTRTFLQSVGRMDRAFIKSPDIHVLFASDILKHLDTDILADRLPILSPVVHEATNWIVNSYPAYITEAIQKKRTHDQWERKETTCEKHTKSINNLIGNSRKRGGWSVGDMKTWHHMRENVLHYPTISLQEKKDNPQALNNMYISLGSSVNQYYYAEYQDYQYIKLCQPEVSKSSFQTFINHAHQGNMRWNIKKMSETDCGLTQMMKYSKMPSWFKERGYATAFKINDYVLTPVIYNNILKGALGETAGACILFNELGLVLKNITDPTKFEFFDFEVSDGVYIDMKNWKSSTKIPEEDMLEQISHKLDHIGGKKALIIKVLHADGNHPVTYINDPRIVMIPALLDDNGHVIEENLKFIKRETNGINK